MSTITRTKAGLLHFCLSLGLFSIIFGILIMLWYPEPYFSAAGGWQGLKIVASIDVVLGPLLTFIVFNPAKSKRELSIDLSIIFSVQIAALLWGVYTVYQQRPVAAVFWESSFFTVSAIDLTQQNYPLDKLKAFSSVKPALIYADKPRTTEGLNRLLENLQKHEISPLHQTEFYRPLTENFSKILDFQVNLNQDNPALTAQIDTLVQNSHYQKSALKGFTLNAKYHDMILVFSPTGEMLGYLTP